MLLKMSDLNEVSFCRRWLLTQEITTDQSVETKDQWNLESSVIHETPVSLPTPPPPFKGEAPLLKKKLDDCNRTKPKRCLLNET